MLIRIILLLSVNLQPIEVQSFLASKGLKAQVQMIRLSEPLNLGAQQDYFNGLIAAFQFRGYRHILLNPFYSGKTEYILGFASGNLSMSVWNDTNDKGEPRRLHSLSAIAHELGHSLLRLKHTTGCTTIMDEQALWCPNLASLTFSPAQRMKIKFKAQHRR